MKLTIERDALLKALAHVHGAVERKTTIPVLSMVKLEAAASALALTATDLELEARATVVCGEIAEDGAVAAPAETLVGFVRKLPAGVAITLHAPKGAAGEGGRLDVTAGRARMSIPILPAADFPAFPEPARATRFALGSYALRRLIDKTRFAVSKEATRYYLGGIFLHFHSDESGDDIRAVATDGHRLAMASTRQPAGIEEGMTLAAIVPAAACAEIRKLIVDHAGDVEISCDGAVFKVEAGGASLATKVIDGQFPDYQRIVPKPAGVAVCVDRQALIDAVSRVMIVAPENARSIRLSTGDGDALIVRARDPDRGEAADELIATAQGGVEIGFNGRFLLDQLGVLEGDEVTLRIIDARAPTRIDDSADAHVLGVLMPLRV